MAPSGKPRRKPNKVTKFFKEVRNEMKRVTWPNRKELVSYTSVVIVASVVMTVFLGIIDFGVSFLVRFIIQR